MAEQIHDPHDKGYKTLFSYREIFLELLDSFVTQGWISQLDRKSVIRIDKSFTSLVAGNKDADLVYRLKVKGKDVIFYLLFELQATVDFQMPFRLLEYMVEIWRDYLKGIDPNEVRRKGHRFPMIVPMVLYNGVYNWTACRSFKETLEGTDLFGEYVVDFKYILIDVQRFSKEFLFGLANMIGTVFLLDRQSDFEEFTRRCTLLKPVLEGLDEQRSQAFMLWFTNVGMRDFSDAEKKKLIGDIDVTKPEEGKKMISYLNENLRRYYDEAEKKGKLEVAKNLLLMKMDVDTVAKAAALPVEKILELQKSLLR
jgi:predicted transposase YdaD